ncbi:MAG: carboxylesterase family protein [Novosphingobium sp.]
MPSITAFRCAASVIAVLGIALSCSGASGEPGRPDGLESTIAAGTLRGVRESGVEVFRGIPFAAPPVGELRWKPPQPVAHWDGVRDAGAFAHDCMQTPFPGDEAPLRTTPSEDCLYLNVWKPAATRVKGTLPVLVWFYGGAFVTGGTSPAIYDGSSFARQDVIFVSFNYRLGRFGFFSHPALTAEQGPVGNFAVSDQVAALRWVKDNIAAFGGDPAKVTLIGESAGGTSVINMLTVPSARGLFRGAIVMSGGGRSLLRTATLETGEQVGIDFAHREGIEGAGRASLKALRALPAAAIQGKNLFADRLGQPMTYVGGYVADGNVVPHPSDTLMEAGDMARVPVMIGWTSADAGLSLAQDKDALFASFGDHAAALRKAYDPEGVRAFDALRDEIIRDQYMVEPARFVARHAERLGQNAYLYRFGYVAQTMRGKWTGGAPHATDIPYFFDTVDARYGAQTSVQDRDAARVANRYVVDFVKTGSPGGEGYGAWKPYRRSDETMLAFDMDARGASVPAPSPQKLDAVAAAASVPEQ